MSKSERILVYLANGVQGGAVAREAARRGFSVTALVRDPARSPALARLGIDLAQGDLADPASLRAAHAGVSAVVLQVPIGPPEIVRGLAANAVAAARAARVDCLVLKLASASRSAPCEEQSFVANAEIETMVRSTGLSVAIVRPTMYLDNLLKPSVRHDLAGGMFQMPIDASQRIAWTSVDDCAAAALTLIENRAHGGSHLISGPDSVNGSELAAALSIGLGRRIDFHSEHVEAFERSVDATMGPGMGRRVASKFRYFRSHRDDADAILAPAYVDQPGLDGFRPTSIQAWTRKHAGALNDVTPM